MIDVREKKKTRKKLNFFIFRSIKFAVKDKKYAFVNQRPYKNKISAKGYLL